MVPKPLVRRIVYGLFIFIILLEMGSLYYNALTIKRVEFLFDSAESMRDWQMTAASTETKLMANNVDIPAIRGQKLASQGRAIVDSILIGSSEMKIILDADSLGFFEHALGNLEKSDNASYRDNLQETSLAAVSFADALNERLRTTAEGLHSVRFAISWFRLIFLTAVLLLFVIPTVRRLSELFDQLVASERTLKSKTDDLAKKMIQAKRLDQLFRTAVNSAPSGLLMIDQHGLIKLANDEAAQMFGYTTQELDGMHIETLIPQRYQVAHRGHREAFFLAPSRRPMGVGRELFAVKKDGIEFPIEIGLNPTQGQGANQYVLSSIIDITDRKRQSERMLRINRVLQEKNREMEQFVYTVSHDLKSPLVTSQSFLGFLKEDLAANDMEAVHDSLERLFGANRRMRNLIDDILEFSRAGSQQSQWEGISTKAIVTDVLDELAGYRRPDDRIIIDDDLPLVVCDKRKIRSAFENLIVNSFKYGRTINRTLELNISCNVTDSSYDFTVTDNGPGIDQRYHDRIFDLFQRVDSTNEGNGVGLAIVKRVGEIHEGRAWVVSEVGHGASFGFSVSKNIHRLINEDDP